MSSRCPHSLCDPVGSRAVGADRCPSAPLLGRIFARSSSVLSFFFQTVTIGARNPRIESVDRARAVTPREQGHRRRARHALPPPRRPLRRRTRAPSDQHGVTWAEATNVRRVTIITYPPIGPKPRMGSDPISGFGNRVRPHDEADEEATRARPVYCRLSGVSKQ